MATSSAPSPTPDQGSAPADRSDGVRIDLTDDVGRDTAESDDADTVIDLPSEGSDQTGRSPGPGYAAPLVAVALPFIVHATFIVHRSDWAGSASNDIPLTEISVRQVGEAGKLLGPYSRFGFHHPGPLGFYLMWPFYRLTGDETAGLYLGALAINLAAAVALVLVVRRSVGVVAGYAACVGILGLYAFNPSLMAYPWNPLYIVLPLALVVAATAAAVARSPWYLVLAGLSGTLVVQSHLGPAPAVAVLLAGGLTAVALVWRRVAIRPVLAAGGLGALLWSPAVYQQFATEPGNLGVILNSMTAGAHDRVAIRSAMSLFIRGATSFPVGPGSIGDLAARPSWPRLLTMGVFGALLVGGGWHAHRRRHHAELALIAASSLTLAAAAVSLLGVRGEPHSYLAYWIAGASIVGWVGVVSLFARVAASRRSPRPSGEAPVERRGRWSIAIGAAMLAGGAVVALDAVDGSDREPWVFDGTGDNQMIADDVTRYLRANGIRRVQVVPQQATWGPSAALVNELELTGISVSVARPWVFMYDPRYARTPPGTPRLRVLDPAGSRPPSAAVVVSSRSVLVVAQQP